MCPNPALIGSGLTCGAAVSAAVRALPADHPIIVRIQFHYGSHLPAYDGTFPQGAVPGYVIFSYADSLDRQHVQLTWWHGTLSVGDPLPY